MNDLSPRGLYARRLPPQEPSLRQLADRLVVASHDLRTCNDADWNRVNDEQADAQAAFRAAVERLTNMRFDQFAAAIAEG